MPLLLGFVVHSGNNFNQLFNFVFGKYFTGSEGCNLEDVEQFQKNGLQEKCLPLTPSFLATLKLSSCAAAISIMFLH